MGRKKRKKRGFPVGILVDFDEQIIHIWKIFSESVKIYRTMPLKRKWKNASEKDYYHYFEDLLDLLRPPIENGLRSILLVSPRDKDWSEAFLSHITKHHRWLINSRGPNQAFFGNISGSAHKLSSIAYLLEKEDTKKVLKDLISQEGYFLIKKLEKTINIENPNYTVLYGLKEIEERIYEGGKKDDSVSEEIDYLLLTDQFLENHPQKNRIYRLKQIAKNKGINTKVIPEESTAGDRISQFGGILCFKAIKY
jgi:stalled ribosome rescue protein Dom34